jgi:hypothetical protein
MMTSRQLSVQGKQKSPRHLRVNDFKINRNFNALDSKEALTPGISVLEQSTNPYKAACPPEKYLRKLGSLEQSPTLSSPIPTNSAPRARAATITSDTSSGYFSSDSRSEINVEFCSDTAISAIGDLEEEHTLSKLTKDLELCELDVGGKFAARSPGNGKLIKLDEDCKRVEKGIKELQVYRALAGSKINSPAQKGFEENNYKPAIATVTQYYNPDGDKHGPKASNDSERLKPDQESRNTHPKRTRPSRKRQSPNDDGNDPDESSSDDEDDRDKKRKRPDNKAPRKRIRCPFYLKNPAKYGAYQACSSGMGFEDMGRLRYHLKRVHTQPFRCQRCQTEMSSKAVLKEHLRSGGRCEVLPELDDDRISPEQWETIDSARGCGSGVKSIEAKYTHLYRTIFGPTGPMPSPCTFPGLKYVLAN